MLKNSSVIVASEIVASDTLYWISNGNDSSFNPGLNCQLNAQT